MTKIFICTPAYDGKVTVPYAIALSETCLYLFTKSIQFMTHVTMSSSFLSKERNKLVMEFLKTDCTHMMCIDADIGWKHDTIYNMIQRDIDFIAGCYLSKVEKGFTCTPQFNSDGSLIVKNDLIKMDYVPAGFMLIKRHVLEKMCQIYSALYYEGNGPGYCLFNTELHEGAFWGEDYTFCRRMREAGFEIWTDPTIELDHNGNKAALSAILTQKQPTGK